MLIAHLINPRLILRVLAGLSLVVGIAGLALGVTTPSVWISLGLGVVLGAYSFVYEALVAQRRRRALRELAARLGWEFHEQLPGVFAGLDTAPFTATDSTYMDVVKGRYAGFECYDGTFEWRIKVDDATLSARHRVCAVRLPDLLPRLVLLPEGFSGTLARAVGRGDIDFESAEFNEKWRVVADDARVAHDILNPRVLLSLERLSRRAPLIFDKGFAVRIDDALAGTESLADRLDSLVAVVKHLPRHVIDDHGVFANSMGPLPSMATPGGLTDGYQPELQAADDEHLRRAALKKFEHELGPFPRSPQPGETGQ